MKKPKPTSTHHWNKFFSAHARDSERAVVVWAGSYVETHLKNYLRSMIRSGKESEELFEGYRPLSTFAGCISVGYAFRLLSRWQRDELNRVRHIRNHFAHEPYQATLLDEEVLKHVKSLRSYDPFEIAGEALTNASARTRYVEACGMLTATMNPPEGADSAAPNGDA